MFNEILFLYPIALVVQEYVAPKRSDSENLSVRPSAKVQVAVVSKYFYEVYFNAHVLAEALLKMVIIMLCIYFIYIKSLYAQMY